ncbi:MAG: hypothetical protein WD944_01105 [Steroidobacteraceae bacterium]
MQGRLAKIFALLVLPILPASGAHAGGPLALQDDGTPFAWSTAAPIAYRTDDGPLSASVAEGAARARVQAMFNVWQNVASSSISYTRAGFIEAVGVFSDGDVSNLGEFNAVEGDCGAGNQSPIIYDADATIFIALGIDETSVIGFAGPCAIDPGAGQFVSGRAVMNGLFQDGEDDPVPDLTAAEFDATFVHEFGHFSGLDHSQINVECGFGPCSNDNLAGLPTMFPFLVSATQGSLSIDDIAWISRLYPAGGASGFAATHGTITGTVFFSDGETHAQLVNVVARLVDNPGTAGVNESRTTAGSNVSGYKFRLFNGNPINAASDIFGSQVPSHIGLYEISLPPGDYTIEVESIDAQFVEGSSVGGPVRIPMPGTAPAPIGPITVTAGATDSGNDVTLIGTDPRFDQFEGPGP